MLIIQFKMVKGPPKNSKRRWTPEEDALLTSLAEKRMPVEAIQSELERVSGLHRTPGAVSESAAAEHCECGSPQILMFL